MADLAAALEGIMGHQSKTAVQGGGIFTIFQAQAGQGLTQGLGGTRCGRTAGIFHLGQHFLHGGHAHVLGQVVVLPAVRRGFFPGGVHLLLHALGQPDGQIGDLGCLDLADLELRHPLFPQLAQPFQRRAAQARFLAQGHEAFHIEIGTDLVFRNGNLAHSLSLRASG